MLCWDKDSKGEINIIWYAIVTKGKADFKAIMERMKDITVNYYYLYVD